MTAMTATTAPPLALYLHFPWCVSKCPYCDFNSFALHGELPQAIYLDALERDLRAQLGSALGIAAGLAERPVVSIFLGGGTPSLFEPEAIGQILTRVASLLRMQPGAEITLEANPGTIERGRFAGYAAVGVNRVSLGAQTFDPMALRALGRIHSPDDTRRAAEELHAAGLPNFNLDLMYGLPGQDLRAALRDVDSALALQPAHLSHYHLTLEPGTPFAASPPSGLPADDATASMLQASHEKLAAAGFERYEVSAYAKAGRRCTHNLNYWQFGDYLGAGAGAHGKLTTLDGSGAIFRSVQLREPRRYLAAAANAITLSRVADAQLPFEFMLNALRLTQGAAAGLFEQRSGIAWQQIEPTVARLVQRGLLEPYADTGSGRGLRATARGFDFLNEILVEFLPDTSASGYAQAAAKLSK